MDIDYNRFKEAVLNRRVRFRHHSAEMMIERNITRKEIFDTILSGEIIEEYINDKPFSSCLFFFNNGERPIHVVSSYNNVDDYVVIITVYIPDMDHFENNFKTRRKKYE